MNADNAFNKNLFDYCENNPLYFVDEDGNWGIPGLSWPGEIHREVQNHIVQQSNNEIIMEVTIIQSDGKRGRIDLLNPNTGEYWEVKTGIPLVDTIREQLDRYLNPIDILKIEEKSLKTRLIYGTSIIPGTFEFTSKLGTKFRVHYEQTDPGIVRYTYTADFEEFETITATAAAAATAGSIGQAVGKSIMSHKYSLGPGFNSRLLVTDCRLK